MERDLELVRKILIEVERAEGPWWARIDGYSSDQIEYHVELLREADYIVASYITNAWRIERLTWDGHEFLDAARNDGVWNEAKDKAGDQFIALPFQVLSALLVQILKERLGISGG